MRFPAVNHDRACYGPQYIRCHAPSYLSLKRRGHPTVFRHEHTPGEAQDSEDCHALGGYVRRAQPSAR